MELLVFVVILILIVALVGSGNTVNAMTAVAAPTAVGKASGCGAFVLGWLIIGMIALWIFAALGGGVVGSVEVRPDTAPADYSPCSKAQHGQLSAGGRFLCIEDGHNPGQFYWRPWPQRRDP